MVRFIQLRKGQYTDWRHSACCCRACTLDRVLDDSARRKVRQPQVMCGGLKHCLLGNEADQFAAVDVDTMCLSVHAHRLEDDMQGCLRVVN